MLVGISVSVLYCLVHKFITLSRVWIYFYCFVHIFTRLPSFRYCIVHEFIVFI